MKQTNQAIEYIAQQLKDVRGKLRESEDEFNKFSQDNDLISIDLQTEGLLAKAQATQNDIQKLEENQRELEGILQLLKQFIEKPVGSDHDFYSANASGRYQKENDELVALMLRKDTLLKTFTPKHPEVVAVRDQIVENARKMALHLKAHLNDMEKKRVEYGKALAKVERQTDVLMDKKLEFNRIKRKVELYNDMAVLLERKNQEALIRRAEKPEEVKIVKPAPLPTRPINSPKTAATGATGVLIGLVLGIVIGFIVETFDTSLGAIEDVEETLGTQVLAIIPQVDLKDLRSSAGKSAPESIKSATDDEKIYLMSHFAPKSMAAEGLRALRTNIQFKDPEKKIETIVITSTSPKEGKTLVALNLAITMAQAGMKILLVGSDLRKPVIEKLMGLEIVPGLTNILLGSCSWRDAVRGVTDLIMGKLSQSQLLMTPGLDNLHLITSGPMPPNPAELLESRRLTDFIQESKKEYDMVILDTPPILSTADAAFLATKVDGVIMVYRVGSVSRGLLKRSTTQLRQVKCNLLGVVLNGMRPDVSPDFQDYKYYSYYYAYGEKGESGRRAGQRRGLTLLTKKGDAQGAVAAKVGKGKRMTRGKMSLLLLAVALLASGILWQNGLLHSSKGLDTRGPSKKGEIQPAAKKDGAQKQDQVKRETASKMPKTHVPVERPPFESAGPISKSQNAPEAAASTEQAPHEKERSVEPVQRKVEIGFVEPQSSVTAEDPTIDVETPLAHLQVSEQEPPRVELPAPPEKISSAHLQVSEREPPRVEMPASPEQISSYPYSILLHHYRHLFEAKKRIARYRKQGLFAYLVKVELNNGTWYRIFAGHFQDRKQAKRFKKEHGLTRGVLKRTKYANLIDTYKSPDALEDRIQALVELGYSPYVIKGHHGKSLLFVGTFYTREGAETQYHDLKSHGVENRVVER
jgi:tyrosine-protein kinase Etk/Wzc